MLIHVNPREVAGLQYLGERYGAKMTVNPDTGLPEAFNFMRFMPMIAGAALSPFITPMGAAAVVGAVEGVRTKSALGGLKGALGAYGGASLGTSLASFGAEGAGQTALAAGTEAGTTALNTAVAAPTPVIPAADTTVASINAGAESLAPTFNNIGPDQAAEMLRAGQIGPEAYAKYGQGYSQGVSQYNPTTFSNMGAGISRAFTDPGAAGSALMADPMRTAANIGSALIGSQEESKPYEPPGKKTYASSTKADPYKRNYRENPNPYDSSEFEYFQPNALYVKEGGYIGMNVGGKPPQVGMPAGLSDDYKAYLQQLQFMLNNKDSALTLPQSAIPISQPKFATQAASGTVPNAYYAPGGITRIQKEGQVRGDGDGMEDKVYGNIEGRQKVALSRDEFIVPADVVSGIGNGSSNAGADKLYKMMDRVRKARTGIKKQGKQIKGDRYVPA
jgi:hypothetical protein